MDPPANLLNPIDIDSWFHDFYQDDYPFFGVGTPEYLVNKFETFDQDLQNNIISDELIGIQDFDPFEDISLWGCCYDVCTNDECQVTNSEAKSTTASDGGRKGRRRRSIPLELEEIEKHFEMPITMAAKKLKVGLSALKKRCRELSIKRWPHRKLKSLQSVILNAKEFGLHDEIEMLEEHKRMMEKLPDLELTQSTKKLRQACFKANYKKRRLNINSHIYPVTTRFINLSIRRRYALKSPNI